MGLVGTELGVAGTAASAVTQLTLPKKGSDPFFPNQPKRRVKSGGWHTTPQKGV